MPACNRMPPLGFAMKRVDGAQGQYQRTGGPPQLRIGDGAVRRRRTGPDADLLDTEFQCLVVHDDIEEFRDIGLQREGRHPPAADQLRIDRPIRTRPKQFRFRAFGPCPGDDHQIGADGAARQGHIDIVGIAVERGDQRVGVLDPGGLQHAVIGDIAQHSGEFELGQPLRVAIDDHDLFAEPGQVLRGRTADPPPAAHDDVPAHALYPVVHPASLPMLMDVAVDQRLEQDAEHVEDGPGAEQDERHGEHLPGRAQWVYFAESDRGDRGDGLIERVQIAEPEQAITLGAGRHHEQERHENPAESANRVHAVIVSSIVPGARRARIVKGGGFH